MTYRVGITLGKASTSYSQIAWTVNAAGTVFGSGDDGIGHRAPAKWVRGSYDTPTFLDIGAATLGEAYGCEDAGVRACGYVNTAPVFFVPQAAVWDGSGFITYLDAPNPGHSNYSDARAMNNVGQIVGWGDNSAIASFVDLPLLWDNSTTPTVLDSLSPGKNARANGINDAGVIVGYAHDAADVRHAVTWDINTGAITQVLAYDSQLFGVNDAGNFGGGDNTVDGVAIFYDGAAHTLQTGVGEYSEGWAIGGDDIVAGETSVGAVTYPAVWYQPSRNLELLTAATSFTFAEALAVSSTGYVCGFVQNGADLRAILWEVADVEGGSEGFDEWWDVIDGTVADAADIAAAIPLPLADLSDVNDGVGSTPTTQDIVVYDHVNDEWTRDSVVDGGTP